jgi:serine/threonine protein kinase
MEAQDLCPTCRSARPDASWPTLPYLFRNRYWFIRKLGRGGMGAVFLAYDPQAATEEERLAAQEARDVDADRSIVAIKVVQQRGPRSLPEPQQRSQRKLLKDAFQNEIAAARMVARYRRLFVTAKGHDDLDPAYLAMEYIHQGPPRYSGDVPWQTLSALIGKVSGRTVAPLPPVQVAQIGIVILHGIGAMAQHNIVHNDLKPDNIFVRRVAQGNEERHEVKIMDLGVWTLDQALAETESVLYGVGDVRGGTADYMSPEQTAMFANMPQERRLITRRSDLHAVSSVLWELATGKVPFPLKRRENAGDQSSAYAERLSRLSAPPPRPVGMPEGLYDVVVRGLAKEPSDRWADAHEMRERLKGFIDDALGEIGNVERSLSALKAQLEPFRQLLLAAAQLEERLRALKQSGRESEQGSARDDTSSLVKEVHTVKEELTAIASKLSVPRPFDSSRSVPALSAPARQSSVSIQPLSRSSTRPDGIDEKSTEVLAPKKKISIGLILVALLSIGGMAVFMVWMTGRIPKPEPSSARDPLPPSVTAESLPTGPTGVPPDPSTTAEPKASSAPPGTVSAEPPAPGKTAVPPSPSPQSSSSPPAHTSVPTVASSAAPPGLSKLELLKAALSGAMANAAANAASSCSGVGSSKGSPTVTVTIGPDGSASSAQLSPPFLSNELNECIKNIFRKIRIEPTGAAEIQVSRTVHIQ